ncbi:MAG: hypothetical protein ACRDD7_17585 [Peptostreptococcaceae bacterium]
MKNIEKVLIIVFLSVAVFTTGAATKDIKQDKEAQHIQDNLQCYQLADDGDIQITLQDGSGYYFNIYEDTKSYKLVNKNEDIYLSLDNRLSIELDTRDVEKIDINKSSYANYKNSFIALNGLDWWEESTEEAGLDNTLESYLYFLKYRL